ncbi:MAG: hypothetical protein H6729_07950 [Deltaproteobacteria bacterium]|nr:hypothetical protein [Deltaproteobacteria bacterium]
MRALAMRSLLLVPMTLAFACGGPVEESETSSQELALRVSSDVSDATRWTLVLHDVSDDRILARLHWNVRDGEGEVVVEGEDERLSMQAQGVGLSELEVGLKDLWQVRARGAHAVNAANAANAQTDIASAERGLSRPIGNFDKIFLGTGSGLTAYMQGRRAAGWSFDPDNAAASVWVHFYINSVYRGATYANQVRTDVNQVFGVPGNHGFMWTFNVTGLSEVVPYGIDLGSDGNPSLGMRLAGCTLFGGAWYCQ